EFDAVAAKRVDDAITQGGIGVFQDEREGVVATAVDGEIGLVKRGVEVVEEQTQVLGAAGIVGVESLELRATEHGVEFGATHVVGGIGEDEVGVEVRMAVGVIVLE